MNDDKRCAQIISNHNGLLMINNQLKYLFLFALG